MIIDLPFIWAGLIAFAVLAYALLDGFDLGIGILFPFLKNRDERHLAMNTIAPVWDGNQTWLVLGSQEHLSLLQRSSPAHPRKKRSCVPLRVHNQVTAPGHSTWPGAVMGTTYDQLTG